MDCSSLAPVFVIVRVVFSIIQYVVPVVLILLGSIDLVKAVTQGKEEEIKKGQKTLITRAVAAVIVFVIPLLVSIIMGLIGNDDWKSCWDEAKDKDIGTLLDGDLED